ncbi:MAG: hypothetical protein GY930_01550, partial [bacterium]|nr:hypothetical protein [bacterium]
ALQEAIELAPEWEVPRRRRDDLLRQSLLGPRALRSHWAAMEQGEDVAMHAYLSGRLNTEHSAQRFLQATRSQPRNPWGLHGLAFVAAGKGRHGRAVELQTEALWLAREAEERRLFTLALSNYQRAAGDAEQASRTLAELWRGLDPGFVRDGVELQLIFAEVAMDEDAATARAKVRANRLVRQGNLARSEWNALFELGLLDAEVMRAWLVLRHGQGDLGDWARDLALRLFEVLDPEALGARRLRAPYAISIRQRTVAMIERGQVLSAWNLWRGSLPNFLGDLFSFRMDLEAVGKAARDYHKDPDNPETSAYLARALLRVGWFEEAQAFVRSLPPAMDLDLAMEVDSQATLARESIRGLAKLMRRVDRGRAHSGPSDPLVEEQRDRAKVDSLDDLLRAVGQVLWQAGPAFFGETSREEMEERLVASPRLRFGSFAQVVHPGPVLSSWDAGRDLGATGEPVPGLAQELGRLGRVGIFGSAIGVGAPDATVLRLVYSEGKSGEHLGVPFHGTVLWCDGTDVGARNVRMGASVAGAALHEGYFIDLHEVRVANEAWERLATRFQAGGSEARLTHLRGILSDPGLPTHAPDLIALQTGPVDPLNPEPLAVDPWLETGVLLGQANRNRLAWMGENAQERGGKPGSLAPPSFEDAVLLTAIHEEGHLCERTRFLPLSTHWPAALGFLADQNFSPLRVQQRFEYRAQLTALCAVRDPRLALVEILDLAEGSTSGLPHGPAYAELLKDLVAELGAGLKANAPWLRGLKMDPDHRLVFQLHRLPKEALLATALRVAAKEGLVAPGYLGK